MKRIILLLAITLSFFQGIGFSANSYNDDVRNAVPWSNKTNDIQDPIQILFDYDVRTDGQPVYIGYAVMGRATSEDSWIIYLCTYDINDQITSRKVAYGIYDNRAVLTYQ